MFPQGFSCLVVLWILLAVRLFRLRGFHSLWLAFPKPFCYFWTIPYAVRTPECTHSGLGSFPFARRYLGNHCCFLFLRVLRCFSSPGSLYMAMYLPYSDWSFSSRVSPFRNLRVNGYLLLTVAYRSLSRLSSALSAKASTLRSYSLDLLPQPFSDKWLLRSELDYFGSLVRVFTRFELVLLIAEIEFHTS